MKINEVIDEAIEIIKGTQPFTFGRGKFADAIETLVNFAEWYREQDLIKRSDLDDVVEEEYRCSNCNNHAREDCKWCVANSFKQIPKAEPHCALCDYSAIDDYYLCAMCEYKSEKAEYRGESDGKN